MNRKHIFPVLLAFFVTLTFSCQYERILSSEPTLIEEAKQYFESSQMSLRNLRTTKKAKSPIWKFAKDFRYLNKDIVEVPLRLNDLDYKYSIRFKTDTAPVMKEEFNGVTKLVLFRDKNKKFQMKIMQLVCNPGFLKKNQKNYKQLSLSNLKEKKFSGHLFFLDENDETTAGYLLEDGYVTGQTCNIPTSIKNARTNETCITNWRCETMTICWWAHSCTDEEIAYGGAGCIGVNPITDCYVLDLGCYVIGSYCLPDPDPEDEDMSKCKPCTPVSVGGLAFEYHSVDNGEKPHNGMPYHTHHFRMNQSPPKAGCKCFWDRDYINPTSGYSPQPGAISVEPASGGGVQ